MYQTFSTSSPYALLGTSHDEIVEKEKEDNENDDAEEEDNDEEKSEKPVKLH